MKLTDIETFVVGNPPPHFGGLTRGVLYREVGRDKSSV
jgi:hypothetical protein